MEFKYVYQNLIHYYSVPSFLGAEYAVESNMVNVGPRLRQDRGESRLPERESRNFRAEKIMAYYLCALPPAKAAKPSLLFVCCDMVKHLDDFFAIWNET